MGVPASGAVPGASMAAIAGVRKSQIRTRRSSAPCAMMDLEPVEPGKTPRHVTTPCGSCARPRFRKPADPSSDHQRTDVSREPETMRLPSSLAATALMVSLCASVARASGSQRSVAASASDGASRHTARLRSRDTDARNPASRETTRRVIGSECARQDRTTSKAGPAQLCSTNTCTNAHGERNGSSGFPYHTGAFE